MGLRATWTGAIIMSMMTFPVKAYAATGEQEIKRHNLHSECKHRISQIKVCKECVDNAFKDFVETRMGGENGEKVVWTNLLAMLAKHDLAVVMPMTNETMVKGYELSKDMDVVLSDGELETIKLKSAKAVEILGWMDAAELDPRMPEKAYFVAPDKAGVKPFALILQAMKDAGKYAVGKTMMRDTGKETMVALRPFGHVLLMQTLAWSSDLRDAGELKFDQPAVSEKELALGRQLIEAMGTANLDQCRDQYQEKLTELLSAKAMGQEIREPEPEVEAAPVADSLEALMQAAIAATTSKKSSVVAQAEEVVAAVTGPVAAMEPEAGPKPAKARKTKKAA